MQMHSHSVTDCNSTDGSRQCKAGTCGKLIIAASVRVTPPAVASDC